MGEGRPPLRPLLRASSLHRRRVHISQSTLDCLKGEFDVEPGDGGSRCDYLDEKGIETYLIIASKPEVKKTAVQNGLNGSVSPLLTPDRGAEMKGLKKERLQERWEDLEMDEYQRRGADQH